MDNIIKNINELRNSHVIKKHMNNLLKKIESNLILKTEIRLGFTDTPTVPFIWHREEELMCRVLKNGIMTTSFGDIKNIYNISQNVDDDEIIYVINQKYIHKYNFYVCLHSLMYYELHKTQVNNYKLQIPPTYNKQITFSIKTIPIDKTKLIELPNGLEKNKIVNGPVYIHNEAYSPLGTLHFQLDHTKKTHILFCNIKSFELDLNIYSLFILHNET